MPLSRFRLAKPADESGTAPPWSGTATRVSPSGRRCAKPQKSSGGGATPPRLPWPLALVVVVAAEAVRQVELVARVARVALAAGLRDAAADDVADHERARRGPEVARVDRRRGGRGDREPDDREDDQRELARQEERLRFGRPLLPEWGERPLVAVGVAVAVGGVALRLLVRLRVLEGLRLLVPLLVRRRAGAGAAGSGSYVGVGMKLGHGSSFVACAPCSTARRGETGLTCAA